RGGRGPRRLPPANGAPAAAAASRSRALRRAAARTAPRPRACARWPASPSDRSFLLRHAQGVLRDRRVLLQPAQDDALGALAHLGGGQRVIERGGDLEQPTGEQV